MALFDLTKKVAVVFGGNGYLGLQFCGALLEHGAKVYSCDIIVDRSRKIKNYEKKYPERFEILKVDASIKEELIELRGYITEREKAIDVLVNSIYLKGKDWYLPFEEVSLEGWNIGLMGHLTIPFLTIQTFIPDMKKQRSGSIINLSSHYGLVGNDQRIYVGSNLHEVYLKKSSDLNRIYSPGVYNAAKGGLINFTRYLAAYYGEYNIRVNCISPGGIRNDNENETFVRKYSEKVPLGRKANPDEINGALIFLASDASTYVTGHNLIVDGGYTIW
jgi:NAD(P)-dependent dehydrogenase (short-subunit alcohol dehydrogenase family)